MALLPLLLGAFLAGWTGVHLVLFFAWFAGFHFFNAATLFLKGRRSARIRTRLFPALIFWAVTAALLGIVLIVWHPQLLTWIPAFAPLVAIAFIEAWRRQERSMPARVSTILASSLMLPLAYWLGVDTPSLTTLVGAHWTPIWVTTVILAAYFIGTTILASSLMLPLAYWLGVDTPSLTTLVGAHWTPIWVTTVILAAYFIGTVPYVRSLIRGKNDHRWVWAATAWHVCCTFALVGAAAYGLTSWWMVALWGILAARCLLVPLLQRRGTEIRPALIGMSEFVATAVLTALLLISL